VGVINNSNNNNNNTNNNSNNNSNNNTGGGDDNSRWTQFQVQQLWKQHANYLNGMDQQLITKYNMQHGI